ncbi:hypothetical protein [Moorena sp. SIO4G3]|uniref:hypothetical protein n=1 Tax=Moorena sp. SIO4G3 TaxID=2607821 RepID=UPI00142B010E|nr:hypothetical protein [Moorena sp. SIO4G3]NEO75825.1 hypothetical protein [Moorena sp. SIO4G3]
MGRWGDGEMGRWGVGENCNRSSHGQDAHSTKMLILRLRARCWWALLFNCSPFNKDHVQQCPPYEYLCDRLARLRAIKLNCYQTNC